MPPHKKLTWQDHILLLTELSTKSVQQVATDLNMKEATVRNRILSARATITEAKQAIREINKICRMSPRAQKFVLSSKLLQNDEELLCDD
jgi:hypothetical protein